MTDTKTLAVAGTVVLGGVVLARDGGATATSDQQHSQQPQQQSQGGTPSETWEPSSPGSEVGQSANGVTYDDPESGEHDDEQGDDANTSFSAIDGLTGVNYAPDTEDGEAPTGGVTADPGTSEEFGNAGEQQNDDLSGRAAESEMEPSTKEMFDRFANRDGVTF